MRGAVIDSVLDYDAASGRTSTRSAEAIANHVRAEGISIDWLLETHAHADHLSAAPWLQKRLGGAIALGAHIRDVQAVFGDIFNAGEIGRASCRERVSVRVDLGVRRILQKQTTSNK